MKRPLTALLSAAVLIASFASGAATADDRHGHGRGGEGRESHGEGRGGPPPWAQGPQREGPQRQGPQGYGPPPGRWARQAPSQAYGPPPGYPPEAYSPRGYGVRRGGYLPPDLRSGMVQDYGRYRLRAPPRGYSWVRVGAGYALVDTGSGQIFDIVPY